MKFRFVIGVVACITAMHGYAVDASNRYRSPRNPERAVRKSTELIVLHTTEAPARSSLNKLSDRGEAHFCVTEEGRIYRIVDRDKEAFHAGRSMWKGKEDVDKFSIGIECVGYHDKPMPTVQLDAIKRLVKELQSMYHLSDERVVCHSHVAYGAPNKWHRRAHRGRKRCGMLFAMPSVRSYLGLSARPKTDVDVKARRLVVGDDYLNRVLYGSVDTMSAKLPKTAGAGKRPAVSSTPQRKSSVVAQTKPLGPPKTVADLRSRGYVELGTIKKGATASKVAGAKWNAGDTWYVIRDRLISGKDIDPARIEAGTSVWRPK